MSTLVGRAAETAAAHYLKKQGYKIVQQNWRTRWCEIDIVAQKSGTTYLVEVKYRSTDTQGSGFDYITARKLQQMHVAAEFWRASQTADGDCRLSAIELTGNPPQVTQWVSDIG